MDLGKGEEPVAISAVVHKRRLQRRLHTGHLRQIDISGQLPPVYCLKIEFFDFISVYHNNAGFFRVCGVDKHFLRH